MGIAKQHGRSMEPAVNGIWEYRVLLAITTIWFLPIAAISRLLPRAWRPLASFSDEREGVFLEARRAAGRVIPYVFMH